MRGFFKFDSHRAHKLTRAVFTAALTFTLLSTVADQTQDGPVDTSASTKTTAASDQNQTSSPPGSTNLTDIYKMMDAGVSKDVIRAYIETSPLTYTLTASDVITLKQRGVSDDLITALLKRTAEVRNQAAQANPAPATGAPAAVAPMAPFPIGVPSYGGLDPDSYGYFYHYYLHPRTLASVYQRLGMYGAPYPYAYGFYGQPFNPAFNFGFHTTPFGRPSLLRPLP